MWVQCLVQRHMWTGGARNEGPTFWLGNDPHFKYVNVPTGNLFFSHQDISLSVLDGGGDDQEVLRESSEQSSGLPNWRCICHTEICHLGIVYLGS